MGLGDIPPAPPRLDPNKIIFRELMC